MKKPLLILTCIILLSFTTGGPKSEYTLPVKAQSVYSADLDLDGDNDIVVGHNYDFNTEWSGVSIMLNDGDGNFNLYDSIYLYGGQIDTKVENLNQNPLPEIIGKHVSLEPVSEHIAIIYDFNENDIVFFNLFTDEGVNHVETGDINGNGYIDIVIASNGGKFWGVIYNDGNGNFSEPEYYDTDLYPNDLAVGDIDGNGRDDIAIAGSNTEIYYSFETGFEKFTFSGYEHSVELEDMDLDGDKDVITVWGAFVTTYLIYENLGYQDFQPHIIHAFESTSGGLRTPDLNNDSLPDITCMKGDSYFIFYNQGQLNFNEQDSIHLPDFIFPSTYIWKDLDNNSFPDIIITKEAGNYQPNLKILFNDGNGNFGENPITTITSNFEPQTSNLICFPNPYKGTTQISYELENEANICIYVYNYNGQKIKSFKEGVKSKGIHKVEFSSSGLSNGVYFYSIEVNGKLSDMKKMTVVK